MGLAELTESFWQVQIYDLNPSNPALEILDATTKLHQLKIFN
jgi:putative ABC transport system permease protein